MEKTFWKTTAIIILILFILENLFFAYAVYYSNQEEEKTNICYYDICKEYPDAKREGNICYCYDYDVLGELNLVTTEYMK